MAAGGASRARWVRVGLIGLPTAIVLMVVYVVVAPRVPLSPWTVPLVLDVLDRVNDHPGAVAELGERVRLRRFVTGTVRADETGWREFLLSVPLRGAKSEGVLRVKAGRGPRGPWRYSTVTLETARGEIIDVLDPPRASLPAPPAGRRLYLLPLGPLHRVSLEDLTRDYRRRLGLEIQVLPRVDPDVVLFDHARRQLIAESVIEHVRWQLRTLTADPSAVVIAVTEHDMYIRGMEWRFAFSYRGDDRFAIVSAARMAPLAYEQRGKEYLLFSRVRKMVGKNIGLLLYRFPVSADPTSLLRGNILSVDDIDQMRDRFADAPVRAAGEDVPVSHRHPRVEPAIPTRPRPSGPNAGYPCFVVRPGVTPPTVAAISAEIQTCTPGLRADREYDEFEVDLRSGLFVARKTDLFVPDVVPLALTRCYRLWDKSARAFGLATNHPYDTFPVGSRQPYTTIDLITADGSRIRYDRISEGTGYADAVYEHAETGTPFFRSRFQWNGNGWDLRLADGSVLVFPEAYAAKRAAEGALIQIRDPANRVVSFVRDRRRNLLKLTAPGGGFITFRYDEHDRVAVVTDHRERSVRYGYDAVGRLATVTDPAGHSVRYHYDGANLRAVEDGESTLRIAVRYYNQRIAEISLADERVYRFSFVVENAGDPYATSVVVTHPDGHASEVDIRTGVVRPMGVPRSR